MVDPFVRQNAGTVPAFLSPVVGSELTKISTDVAIRGDCTR